MRAVQVAKPNAPLRACERPIAGAGTRRCGIKVEACGICHSRFLRSQVHFPGIAYPRVPGA